MPVAINILTACCRLPREPFPKNWMAAERAVAAAALQVGEALRGGAGDAAGAAAGDDAGGGVHEIAAMWWCNASPREP